MTEKKKFRREPPKYTPEQNASFRKWAGPVPPPVYINWNVFRKTEAEKERLKTMRAANKALIKAAGKDPKKFMNPRPLSLIPQN